jgi:ribose 5-phosphate isomerase B
MPERVAIANDHAGVALKQALLGEITVAGFEVVNLGTDDAAVAVDYPDFGRALAERIAAGEAKFGIAICGSGIGISIAANRVAGVRAALCHSGREAELARQHNDANILALGARVIGVEEAKDCVRRFLATAFEGGRHAARVKKLG